MEKLLGALTAAEKTPPQKTLAAAFDLVTEKKMRLAASGCLSPAQKERLHAEMLAATAEAGDDDRDTVLIADAAHKMFLALVQAEAYTAAFDTHGKLLFQATCSDKAAAATLGDTANNLRQLILDLVSKHAPEMPPLMRALFAQANKDAGLWTNAVADVTVTVQIDSQLQLAMMAAIKLYIKLYAEDTDAAIMCEGVSGAGTIRTAMRIYFSQNGTYAGATMKNIQIGDADLEGKYFAQSDYSLTGVTATTYLIKAGPPSKVKMRKKPYYTIDQTGREHGTYYTSQ
jgi:hypothetical protein